MPRDDRIGWVPVELLVDLVGRRDLVERDVERLEGASALQEPFDQMGLAAAPGAIDHDGVVERMVRIDIVVQELGDRGIRADLIGFSLTLGIMLAIQCFITTDMGGGCPVIELSTAKLYTRVMRTASRLEVSLRPGTPESRPSQIHPLRSFLVSRATGPDWPEQTGRLDTSNRGQQTFAHGDCRQQFTGCDRHAFPAGAFGNPAGPPAAMPTVRLHPDHPFTAPNANPRTKCRCMNIMKITIGSIIPTAAAADSVQ